MSKIDPLLVAKLRSDAESAARREGLILAALLCLSSLAALSGAAFFYMVLSDCVYRLAWG